MDCDHMGEMLESTEEKFTKLDERERLLKEYEDRFKKDKA